MRMDGAIRKLRWAQQRLKDAHFEACAALAVFDAMDADKSLPVEMRIAARSLKQDTLDYCGRMMRAMETLPISAAGGLPPKTKTNCRFKAELERAHLVATSARYGRPIMTEIR